MATLPPGSRAEDHCDHTGGLTFTSGDPVTRCADCGAEMVWCTKKAWDALQRPPAKAVLDLREQMETEHVQLLAAYHALGNILLAREHQ